MVITILLFEFQYAAMVERKLAYNELNQTQAYYLAKAGARIGMLRVALYARLKSNSQIKSMAGNTPGGQAMLDMALDKIWQLPLPSFPPSLESIKALGNADQLGAETVLKETKITDGSYSVNIQSESSKLNLNSLAVPASFLRERPNFSVPPTRPDLYTGLMLVNLLNSFLRESDDPYAEYPNLRPEEQVMDIMDWVSQGDSRLMGGSKDSYYTALAPPYRSKKGRFFTLEELRLVRGMDEHLFEKLRPYVTVYSYDSKLNINSASEKLYRAIYSDFTDDDLKRIIQQRTDLGGWSSEKQFADFVVSNLGRTGFSTMYPDPAAYPFTVGTESFLIESLGIVKRSGSSIQRGIKVALAFTSARGGTLISGMSQADCLKSAATQFWDASKNGCFTNPTSAQECTNLAGTPQQNGNQLVCIITQYAPAPPLSIPIAAAGKPSGAGTKPAGSNTMKILYWAES